MRNQTSFRLTTTLLPTDTTAKTTTVINKLDSDGNKFYPSFTEETVVLTNDDRTIMETTRAICTDWALTFIKRWLSDEIDPVTWVEKEIPNRKLTWNPWSLAFITASAGDWIDKDDSITWTGNQTYTGNLTSTWSATYNWLLTTNKWVKYPSFANLAALEAYTDPFPWMFAVLDSDWELYRYNAVTEEWSVVTTNEPTNPEMADDETIWTVRIATQTEFDNWTDTGSQWEKLVATPSMILWVTPELDIKLFNLNSADDLTTWQAIFDYCKSGKVALVRRTVSNGVKIYMFSQDVSWQRLRFFNINFSYSWWEWQPVTDIVRDAINIYYSWNTVTSIVFSE